MNVSWIREVVVGGGAYELLEAATDAGELVSVALAARVIGETVVDWCRVVHCVESRWGATCPPIDSNPLYINGML